MPTASALEGFIKEHPLLFVDVNLGPEKSERIVVYENDTAEQLAEQFADKHGKRHAAGYFLIDLDTPMKEKLTELLETQISGVLTKIDEELTSTNSDNF